MIYQIMDRQIEGRLFGDGAKYASKEEVRLQLIDYHSIDWTGEYPIENMTLEDILEYGEWEIVQCL